MRRNHRCSLTIAFAEETHEEKTQDLRHRPARVSGCHEWFAGRRRPWRWNDCPCVRFRGLATKLASPQAAGSLRKIPIGVFDPVYDHLSLDAMLDKVTALGLEAMEIGTGGYPNNRHYPLVDLVNDRGKARAWLKKFEDRGIRVATLSCHGNP